MDADGSNVVQVTNTNAVEEHPTWSADGTRIVFSSTRDGNFELYVMNVDGSSQTRLTNDAASDNAPFVAPMTGCAASPSSPPKRVRDKRSATPGEAGSSRLPTAFFAMWESG
jgi:hypothetical protein